MMTMMLRIFSLVNVIEKCGEIPVKVQSGHAIAGEND